MLLLAASAWLASSFAAWAQTSAPQPPPDAAVLSGDKAVPEHLLGDWGGWRTRLSDQGLDLSLLYTSETAAVVSGGVRRGTDYAHSIDLRGDADMQALLGLDGFSLHGAVVERTGRNASADYLHEYLTEVQEIYGGGGNVAVHLAYLYGEQKLLDGKLDIAAGRLDVGQDFASSLLYCAFMTLSVCPSPRALTVDTAFTIYPNSTWGGRLKISPLDDLALQVGVYQVRPQAGGRSGFNWSASDTTGAFLPAELDWTPQWGDDHLVGHYKIGMGYDTSAYPDLLAGAATDHGRTDFYALADQMLLRTGPGGLDGVILLAGYSRGGEHTSVMNEQEFAGILASGIVPGRAADSIGLQVTHFTVSGRLRATQAAEAAAGLPLSSGLDMVPSPLGLQGAQTDWEVRYDARLVEGVQLMPDLQYVTHPDAVARIPDATVLGVRVGLQI